MDIETRVVDGVAIVELSGKVIFGADLELLPETIKKLLDQGHRTITLKLDGVAYVDSAGLGEIVRAYTTVNAAGGVLTLEGVSDRLQEEFGLRKLARLFESMHTIQDPFNPRLLDVGWAVWVSGAFLLLVIVVTVIWRWAGVFGGL